MPMKLINAIPIRPVMMKVMPNPRKGAGTFEYLIFSLIAAIPTFQDIPVGGGNGITIVEIQVVRPEQVEPAGAAAKAPHEPLRAGIDGVAALVRLPAAGAGAVEQGDVPAAKERLHEGVFAQLHERGVLQALQSRVKERERLPRAFRRGEGQPGAEASLEEGHDAAAAVAPFLVGAQFLRVHQVEQAQLEVAEHLVRHFGRKQANTLENIVQVGLRDARQTRGAALGQFAAAYPGSEVRDQAVLQRSELHAGLNLDFSQE